MDDKKSEVRGEEVSRRSFLRSAGLGVAAVAASSTQAFAAGHDHAGHDHAGHAASASLGKNAKLAAAANHCVETGNACLEHCLTSLAGQGNDMAECAKTVTEMLAACTAIARLAALDSEHLAAMAAGCAEICRSCEASCRKHESHHAVCKACAESCKACIAQCEAVSA